MPKQIVKVIPTEKYFSITWNLGITCNYDCMYCPPELHNNKNQHHTLEELQKAWENIFEKTKHLGFPYKISFTGGEPTNNKYFMPFIEWLVEKYKENIFKLLLTTNGSAPEWYYLKLYQFIDNISFSFHSEFADEQRFFKKMIFLKNNISQSNFIHVNLMDEYWNKDKIPAYEKLLSSANISFSTNSINYEKKIRDYPILKGKQNLEI